MGDRAWFVACDHVTTQTLLRDRRLGRSHPNPDQAARLTASSSFDQPIDQIEKENQVHREMRQALLGLLSTKRVEQLRVPIAGVCREVVSDVRSGGPPADFHAGVASIVPARVIGSFLGVPPGDRHKLEVWSELIAGTADASRSAKARQSALNYFAKIASLGADAPLGAIATLAQEYETGRVARLSLDMYLGGYQTVVSAIDKLTIYLCMNPDTFAQAKLDDGLIPGLVQEVIRLPLPKELNEPPRVLPRYANSTFVIGGEEIRRGALVLISLDSANLDPDTFSEPWLLDPERADASHLGFGYGPYTCVGAALAKLELELLAAEMVIGFPSLRLLLPPAELRLRSQQLGGGVAELKVLW